MLLSRALYLSTQQTVRFRSRFKQQSAQSNALSTSPPLVVVHVLSKVWQARLFSRSIKVTNGVQASVHF